MNGSPCIPAVHWKTGEILKGRGGIRKARKILIQREGPPPFEGAVCRHLCENDSSKAWVDGFICVLHTVWGTQSENERDKIPIIRRCPHCNLEGAGSAMIRWHFDNCKYRNPGLIGV